MGGDSSKELSQLNETVKVGEEQIRKLEEKLANLELNEEQRRKLEEDLSKRKKRKKMENKELLKEPWRSIGTTGWTIDEFERIKKEVVSMKCLEGTGVDNINILLVGNIGAGKSSFVNSISSAFNDHVVNSAIVAESYETTTVKLKQHNITYSQEDKKKLKLKFYDTMGIEAKSGLNTDIISQILNGKVKSGANLQKAIPESKIRENPTKADKMHCVAFVLRADQVNLMNEDVLEKLKIVKRTAIRKGISSVVILTGIDLACNNVKKDTSTVFYSKDIQAVVAKVREKSGFIDNLIFPMRNYRTGGSEIDHGINFLTMIVLRQLVRLAGDLLDDWNDSDSDSD